MNDRPHQPSRPATNNSSPASADEDWQQVAKPQATPVSSTPFDDEAIQSFDAPSHKKRNSIIAVIIVVMLVSIGSGAALSLWYNNPKKVAADAFVGILSAKTTIASGNLQLKDDKNHGTIDVTFNSKSDAPNVKGQFDSNLNINYDKFHFKIGGSSLVSDKGTIYLKFNGIKKVVTDYISTPEVKMYFEASPDLKKQILTLTTKIDNHWVKLDEATLKTLGLVYNHDKAKTCFTKLYDTIDTKQLSSVYNDHPFIIVQPGAGNPLASPDTIKYKVSADAAKFYQASDAFAKTSFSEQVQNCIDQASGQKQQTFQQPSDTKNRTEEISQLQRQIDATDITVWVSRWQHQFTKASLSYKDKKAQTSSSFTINYDQNKKVSAPDPAHSILLKDLQADIEKLQASLIQPALDKNSSSSPDNDAYLVAGAVKIIQSNHRGAYPTLAELKNSRTETGLLSAQLQANLSAQAPDAAHAQRIQYSVCADGSSYQIHYWDQASQRVVALEQVSSCSSVST